MTRFELFCKYIYELQEKLGLQNWTLYISEVELPLGTHAEVHFYYTSHYAWIRLGTHLCDEPYIDPDDGSAVFPTPPLEQLAAHEMSHLLTAELYELVLSALGDEHPLWHLYTEANERVSYHLQTLLAERILDDSATNS